jgi:hypothetical protein
MWLMGGGSLGAGGKIEAAGEPLRVGPQQAPVPQESGEKVRVGESAFERSWGKLLLRGACHVSYVGIKVLDAALYLSAGAEQSASAVLDPREAKVLEIRYLRGFSAWQFRYQTESLVRGNGYLRDSSNGVEQHLGAFNALYRDVSHADVFSLSYDPADERTTLRHNGEALGSVQSALFSSALFSVWFGESPFLGYMKSALLTPLAPVA